MWRLYTVGKLQEARVDEHLLCLLNHDGWKAIGVENATVRAKLIRRAQQKTNGMGRVAAKTVFSLLRDLKDDGTAKGGGHVGQEGSGQGNEVLTVLPGEIS